MARGQRPPIGSFLNPSSAPVSMPAEPITKPGDLVRAFFAKHPDRWFTGADVAEATGLSKVRCNDYIYTAVRKGQLERRLPADQGRRQSGQTYRWVA